MPDYRCPACYITFETVEKALNHTNIHSKSQKRCVVEGCRNKKQKRLSHHTRRKHSSSCQYSCSHCKKRFVRSADMALHVRHVHHTGTIASAFETPRATSSTVRSTMSMVRPMPQSVPQQSTNLASLLSRMAIPSNGLNLDSETTAEDLNTFIDNNLQPNESFNSDMNETVNDVVQFFQEKFSPREILKGGSMGKGTAVKRNADIDLLMILPQERADCARKLKKALPKVKDEIMQELKNAQKHFIVKRRSKRTTKFSTQFTVVHRSEEIKVDLLPTFNVTDINELYNTMRRGSPGLLPYYNASLAKKQVDFVKDKPANVKNLIRLVKFWRKEYVAPAASTSVKIPTSYVLELITIHLWENQQSPTHFNTLKAFRGVMETLSNPESLRAVWDINYDKNTIQLKILNERPLVMDPANPFNNVCHTFSWSEIKTKAREILDKRMLSSVCSDNWR